MPDFALHVCCGVKGEVFAPPKIKRADVIHAGHVVIVFVGHQHAVELFNTGTQHLLAKVRSRIDVDAPFPPTEQRGGAQAFVLVIG